MTTDYIRVYGTDGLVESFGLEGRLEEEGRYKTPRWNPDRCRTDYCDNFWNPCEVERASVCRECGREKI